MQSSGWRGMLFLFAVLFATNCATAQDRGTLNPQPLPPLANADDPATGCQHYATAARNCQVSRGR